MHDPHDLSPQYGDVCPHILRPAAVQEDSKKYFSAETVSFLIPIVPMLPYDPVYFLVPK
jgi:hypothetical protein